MNIIKFEFYLTTHNCFLHVDAGCRIGCNCFLHTLCLERSLLLQNFLTWEVKLARILAQVVSKMKSLHLFLRVHPIFKFPYPQKPTLLCRVQRRGQGNPCDLPEQNQLVMTPGSNYFLIWPDAHQVISLRYLIVLISL